MKKTTFSKEKVLVSVFRKLKMKKEAERELKIMLSISIVIFALLIIYLTAFYYPTCGTEKCFQEALKKCERGTYINSGDMIFKYKIQTKQADKCVVDVTLLQGKLNNRDSLALENKQMICTIPRGTATLPETQTENCHGPLKEGLQNLIIQKLHSHIVQNLGKMSSSNTPTNTTNSTS